MPHKNNNAVVLWACAAVWVLCAGGELHAAEPAETERQLRELPPQRQQITVPDTGEVETDFTLGITNLPKP